MDALELIDQPTEDLEIIDQPTDETSEEEIEGGESKQVTEPADKVDGRKFNPEWSKALKELRELYPDKADMLTKMRDNYARFQDVQALAPKGLEDIRSWKTTIDAVGGPEAAAEMMQRVAGMEALDAKIEAGDDTFVDELPENLQKGVFGMVPQLLNRLSENDSAAFSAAVAPHFQKALAGTGLGGVLDGQLAGLKGIYDRTTDPEMKAEIRQLYQDAAKTKTWYDGQTNGAGSLPAGNKTVSPEVARLQAQVSTYEQGERQKFVDNVLGVRDRQIEDSFKENVAVYVKQFGLSEAQQKDLLDSFSAKVKANQVEGTPFFKQLTAYSSLKKRDQSTVDNYIKSATAQDAKSIVDGLITTRYGGTRTRKAATHDAGTTTTEGGSTRVAQIPDQSQWDMDKMEAAGYEATAKVGKYHLKGGKTVQLVRQ